MVSHDLLKRFSAGFQRFQKTWYCPENNIYEDLRVGPFPTPSSSPAATPGLTLSCSLTRRPAICSSSGTSPTLSLPTNRTPHHHGVSALGHTRSATCTSATSWSWGTRNAAVLPAASGSFAQRRRIPQHLDEPRLPRQGRGGQLLPGADPGTATGLRMWACFSLDNLMGYPWIKSAVDGGESLLHGLYFDMGLRRTALLRRGKRNLCADGQCLRFRHLIREESDRGLKWGRKMGSSRMRSPLLFQTCQRDPSLSHRRLFPLSNPCPGSGNAVPVTAIL